MGMNTTKYNVTEMTEKFYHVKECKPTKRTVKHIKKKPVCKPVTKHNCVTKWEVLPSGEKVCNSDMHIVQNYILISTFIFFATKFIFH